MRRKFDWKKSSRQTLTKLEDAIQRAESAIYEIESTWGAIVNIGLPDPTLDIDYLRDLRYVVQDIESLQYKLGGREPGPLSNIKEMREALWEEYYRASTRAFGKTTRGRPKPL